MAISLSVDIREVDYWPEQGRESLTVIASVTTTGETYNQTGSASGVMVLDIEGSVTDYESATFTCSFGRNATTRIFSQTYTVDRGATATATAKVTLTTGTSAGTISKMVSRTLMRSDSNIEIAGLSSLNNYMDQTYTVRLAYPTLAAKADVYVQSFGTLPAKGRVIATDTTATDISWTPATSQYAPYCTDSQSSVCTVRADFKTAAGVVISTFDASFRLVVPESVRPSISSVTVTDASGDYDDYGVITSDSVLTVTAAASSLHGATIARAEARLGSPSSGVNETMTQLGGSWTCTIDDIPTYLASPTLTVTVYDTRGRSATWTDSMSTGSSSELYFETGTHAERYANGQSDPESTTVRVMVYYTSLYPGGGARGATMTTRYRRVGSSSWSTWSSLSVAGGSVRAQSVSVTGLSATYSWEIQVTLSSGGETATWQTTVGTGSPIMDFAVGGKAVRMWGVASGEDDGLHVGRRLTAGDVLRVDGDIVRGTPSGERTFLTRNYDTDRPVLCEHTGLLAGCWLQGQPYSGGMPGMEGGTGGTIFEDAINILRVNASGQVEMSWTMGGIAGRVLKRIWSGNWSGTGNITVSELPYYNLIMVVCGSVGNIGRFRVLCPRYDASADGGADYDKFSGCSVICEGSSIIHLVAVDLECTSSGGTALRTRTNGPAKPVINSAIGSSYTSTNNPILGIYGVI